MSIERIVRTAESPFAGGGAGLAILLAGLVLGVVWPTTGLAQTDARSRCFSTTLSDDLSIAGCNEAIKANPSDPLLWYSRGVSWTNKGDNDRAISDYNEAIRLDPKYASAYDNRGLAYYNKDDYDRAISDYDTAARLDPKNASVLDNRGIAYYKKGNLDRASSTTMKRSGSTRRSRFPTTIAAWPTRTRRTSPPPFPITSASSNSSRAMPTDRRP